MSCCSFCLASSFMRADFLSKSSFIFLSSSCLASSSFCFWSKSDLRLRLGRLAVVGLLERTLQVDVGELVVGMGQAGGEAADEREREAHRQQRCEDRAGHCVLLQFRPFLCEVGRFVKCLEEIANRELEVDRILALLAIERDAPLEA